MTQQDDWRQNPVYKNKEGYIVTTPKGNGVFYEDVHAPFGKVAVYMFDGTKKLFDKKDVGGLPSDWKKV